MIKVIKHGNTRDYERKTKCPLCGCIFTFTYDDVSTYRGTTQMEQMERLKCVRCPECYFHIDEPKEG